MDAALPGKHTKKMYDLFTKSEARILAQLRTGMIKLNEFLYRIKATDSEICECGNVKKNNKTFFIYMQPLDAFKKRYAQSDSRKMGRFIFFFRRTLATGSQYRSIGSPIMKSKYICDKSHNTICSEHKTT